MLVRYQAALRPEWLGMIAELGGNNKVLLVKSVDSGDVFAQNQSVDVVGAFVGEYGFQVEHVADDVVFEADAVCA